MPNISHKMDEIVRRAVPKMEDPAGFLAIFENAAGLKSRILQTSLVLVLPGQAFLSPCLHTVDKTSNGRHALWP